MYLHSYQVILIELEKALVECKQCKQPPGWILNCYRAKHGNKPLKPSCLSVCLSVDPSVTLRYRGHIGWNYWEIISRLVSLTFPLSGDPNSQHHGSTSKETPQNFSPARPI